jgi:poly(3-hydroxybutyrate) depolymerase
MGHVSSHLTQALPANPPPAFSPLFANWLEGWTAAADGLADCLAASMAGRIRPSDVPRWLELAVSRRPPSWTTPHELVFETPIARLRDFSTPASRGVVPTLVLPPQAGHDSCIVDFSAEQSQMGAIRDAGLTKVLSLDWIGATPATAGASIDDYLQVVDDAVEHCGGRANLIGDCQGGWLATIYAALNPARVHTLTLAGAPVDFHAGEPVIHEALRRLTPGGDLHFYEALVAAGGGVLKGEHMLSGFIVIKPGDEIARQLELLRNVRSPAYVGRYREFENWFKHTQDIPGDFYLWIVRHLFRDNELVRGLLEIGGRRVELGKLNMPLNLLAGAKDHITPPGQVFAVADFASTPEEDVRRYLAPGGHLGLFMGHEALAEHWPPLLAEVFRRSRSTRRAARRAG